MNENESVLKYLADRGADLTLVTAPQECTPLQLAARGGNLSLIKLLLDLGADINGKPGKEGSTIHYALLSGDESIVRFFLDYGATVDDSCPGHSTLCKAIRRGLIDLVPLLLEKGADVNQKEGNWTPVALAFSRKRKDLVKLFIDHGATFAKAGPEALFEAVRSRPLEDIKELLDYGMDPNCHDKYKSPIEVSFKYMILDLFALVHLKCFLQFNKLSHC